MAKKKIAILGGGLGSMTTAFWLTNLPDWQDKYEITVYQLGWRLGGKGAAGRGENGRIQEHGLHIWIGFYDNAFRMIQAAYKELDRPKGSPLRTWRDAFTPHDFIVITEQLNGGWKNWPMQFPTNERTPGDDGEFLTIWDFIHEALQMLFRHIRDSAPEYQDLNDEIHVHPSWLDELKIRLDEGFEDFAAKALGELLELVLKLVAVHRGSHRRGIGLPHGILHGILDHLHSWFLERESDLSETDSLRRLFLAADLGFAMVKGVMADIIGNEVNGFDEIDELDFREWLLKHGASQTAVWSAPIKGLYDLVFGYENGEIEKPNFGAGAALLSVLRIGFDYKGSIFWKMNAGMGDTIFTPFYEALTKRGVKFEFFSRVENLGLSADKTQIETLTIGRQVTLKQPYDPFVNVNGLNCWPAEPNYDQIVEGEKLKELQINLESFYTPWEDVEKRVLKQGVDFDEVVLGISIGSFPYVCSELLAANEKWKLMCENVKTVRTMSMQWWLKPSLDELGWESDSAVMDGYVDPMNTYADMSFLLAQETWNGPDAPKNLAYFCGAMEGGIPDPSDHGFPQRAYDEIVQVGSDYADNNVGFLWPKATVPGRPNALDRSKLSGSFESQYFRANVDPSERYVLSLKGSVKYRLRPDQSGFKNLFLTGDWTYNYFNAGCVEATVVAGMLCANAITGFPAIEAIEGVRPGKFWE